MEFQQPPAFHMGVSSMLLMWELNQCSPLTITGLNGDGYGPNPHDLRDMRATQDPDVALLIRATEPQHLARRANQQNLSSPCCENIPVFRRPDSLHINSHPVLLRGALAIVTNVGAGCGGRGSVGRVVVFCRAGFGP